MDEKGAAVEPPESREEEEKDGLRERVRIRGWFAAVGEEGAVGGGGLGGGKKKPRPNEAAMRESRDGRGCVRTLRYILNDLNALFACGTYLWAVVR